jgi:hypothetical protein
MMEINGQTRKESPHMKLSQKLSALFFMLLLAAIVQGGIASYNLKLIDDRLGELLDTALPGDGPGRLSGRLTAFRVDIYGATDFASGARQSSSPTPGSRALPWIAAFRAR